ncbi:GumC family protein [Methylorubrum populi]
MSEPSSHTGIPSRLWRRRGLFVSVFCLVLFVAVGALLAIPIRYMATGSVIVAEPEPGNANGSAVWAQKVGDPADLESQLLLIRSPRNLQRATTLPRVADSAQSECRLAARTGLARLTGGSETCGSLTAGSEALLDYLEGRVSVGAVGRSRVINISYQSQIPEVAQTVANAVITAFLDDQRINLGKSREEAASWIREEIRQLDKSLQEEEDRVQAYRRRRGLVRGSSAPISAEQLSNISQQLAAAEAAEADAAARLQQIEADEAGSSANSPAVLASRTIGDLKQQYNTISGQIANNQTTLGPRHPLMQSLQREREALQVQIRREIARVAASARQTYEASRSLAASLRAQQQDAKSAVSSATDDEAKIADMMRSIASKRGQYGELYKRASELETERRILSGNTRLVNLAPLPFRPFFPKRAPFLAAGFTLAVLLATAAALLRDVTAGGARAARPQRQAPAIPVLTRLPHLLRRDRLHPMLDLFRRSRRLRLEPALVRAGQDRDLQQALSDLQAHLPRSRLGRTQRTFLITSAASGEGKTFTTLALAARAAASGQRVLVIEGDPQAETFAEALGLPAAPGLNGLLSGRIAAGDAAMPTRHSRLDAVPAGKGSSGEGGARVDEAAVALGAVAQGYDLVLIDGPPTSALIRAYLAARQLDGILVCLRSGHSHDATTAETVARFREAGATVLGAVVTMAPTGDGASAAARPSPTPTYAGAV